MNIEALRQLNDELKREFNIENSDEFIAGYSILPPLVEAFSNNHDVVILNHEEKEIYQTSIWAMFYSLNYPENLEELDEDTLTYIENSRIEDMIVFLITHNGLEVVDKHDLIQIDELLEKRNIKLYKTEKVKHQRWRLCLSYQLSPKEKKEEEWRKEWGKEERYIKEYQEYIKELQKSNRSL